MTSTTPSTSSQQTVKLGGLLLASADPGRLRDWYVAALGVSTMRTPGEPAYDVLDCGGFYVVLDRRDDVQVANPDPARIILNFEVPDATALAEQIDAAGTTWIAALEDRDGSLFATATDPDGNYVQIIQLSAEARAEMEGAQP